MATAPELAAAALLVLMGVAHSYLGERYILIRLFRRQDLPKLGGSDWFTRRTLRFAWHVTTIAWWGFAAILVGLDPLAAIAATFALSAVATAVGSNGRHYAWVVMLAIAALAWWAR